MELFIQSKNKNIRATAEYNPKEGTITVKAQSKVSDNVSTAPTFRSKKSIAKMREGIIKNGVLQKDITFSSPSTAATFVLGSSRNGWITWKDSNGNSLKEITGK